VEYSVTWRKPLSGFGGDKPDPIRNEPSFEPMRGMKRLCNCFRSSSGLGATLTAGYNGWTHNVVPRESGLPRGLPLGR
jgi:hypothetical protein